MVLSLLLSVISLSGQKDALQKANAAFDKDKYREALVYFTRIDGIEKSGPLLFKRGICHYELNQVENATADFRQAYQYGYRNPDIDLYTGMISHSKGKFAEAAEYYKIYLQQTTMESGDRNRVRQLIKQCGRAVDLSYFKPLAIIERAPKGVNSVFDDMGMIPSPSQENKYYFSSNRPNTSTTMDASDYDIYSITVDKGQWSETNRLPFAINKGDEDILIGFTQDAEGMIFYRGEKHKGEISVNTGTGDNRRTTSSSLPSNFNYQSSDVYFYDDNLVIFAARLDDSYGGYDLYFTKKENGAWTDPQNLGPDINGPFDEVSPYLSADGSELYYSSNRDESIGGHDVFFASFLYEAERWSNPTNLGIPINSPGDDFNFELSFDGLIATLSSDRKTAIGGLDIFLARFKKPRGQQTYSSNYIPFADYHIVINDEDMVADNNGKSVTSTDTIKFQESKQLQSEVVTEPIVTTTKSNSLTTIPDDITVGETVATDTKHDVTDTIESNQKDIGYQTDALDNKPSSQIETNEKIVSSNPEILIDSNTTVTQPTKKTEDTSISTSISAPIEDNVLPNNKDRIAPNPQETVKSSQKNMRPQSASTLDIPMEQFSWSPLYYNTGKEILEKENLKQVQAIKDYMNKYQDVSLDIICHSDSEGILEFKLFSSIKLAERIESYLVEQGIRSRRLGVKSYADNYPIAKTEFNGGGPGISDSYNARIEFNFYNSSGLPMPIERISPDIPAHSYDTRNDVFEALTEDGVVYKIQIATVSQMYRGQALSQFNDTAVEADPATGLYMYTIGLYENYAEALEIKREVERFGMTDAQILPYYDGRRLTEDQLVYYVNEFPDLQQLMNYGN